MSKHRVAVLYIVSAKLSVTAAATAYGLSRGHLHRLLRGYRQEGVDALEPRSRDEVASSDSTLPGQQDFQPRLRHLAEHVVAGW
jgi:hypothetical protein